MVRVLYISGMIFFAVLIGDTAHRLQRLYEEGSLFEQYNSERRAAITLLAVSSLGLATLCITQVVRLRRRTEHHSFASMGKEQEPVVDGTESTSIYAGPEAVDEWQDRGLRIRKPSRRQSLEIVGLWMGILRIYCGVLPVIYSYTLLNYLFFWLPSGAGNWIYSILFPVLLLGSVLTSVGILRKKTWGIKFGYAMAIFHLIIFPIGTAAGFVMLIGLMGATSEFTAPRRRRHPASRKAKRKKLHSSAL